MMMVMLLRRYWRICMILVLGSGTWLVAAEPPVVMTNTIGGEGIAFLMGPVLMVLLLAMIGYAAFTFARGQIKLAGVLIGLMFLIVLGRAMIIQYFGPSAGDAATQTYASFPIYGAAWDSPVRAESEVGAYRVIEGYAMVGAQMADRFLRALFGNLIVALVLLIALVAVVIQAFRAQSFLLAGVFLAKLILLGTFGLVPWVSYDQGNMGNPVVSVFAEATDQEAAVQPRVPLIVAWVFAGGNRIAEMAGAALGAQVDSTDQAILTAARRAQLDDALFRDYTELADACNTAVYNLQHMDPRVASGDAEQNLIADVRGSRLPNVQNVAHAHWHALSPQMEFLYQDVDVRALVYSPSANYLAAAALAAQGDDRFAPWLRSLKTRFLGTVHVTERQSSQGEPILPWQVGGRQDRFGANIAHTSSMLHDSWSVFRNAGIGAEEHHIWLHFLAEAAAENRRPGLARVFCATTRASDLHEFQESGEYNWGNTPSNPGEVPPTLYEAVEAVPGLYQHVHIRDWQALVRMRVAMRYLGPDGLNLCRDAGRNHESSPDFWGCLVAGRYNEISDPSGVDNPYYLSAPRKIQQRFDEVYRNALANFSMTNVTTGTVRPRQGWQYAMGGHIERVLASHQGGGAHRSFTDIFMQAQGIQRQIGLENQFLSRDWADGDSGSQNVIITFLQWIAGVTIVGFAGLFAWLAAMMVNVALAIYPHVLGLSTMLLLIMYPLFALMAMMPGRFAAILEWGKCALWLSLWPVVMSIGLAMINQTGAYGMMDYFTMSGRNADISSSVIQIFGAMFVFMAPTFAGMALSLSMSGFQQAVGAIAGTGFKLAGVAMMITGALAGLATAAVAGLAGGAIGGLLAKKAAMAAAAGAGKGAGVGGAVAGGTAKTAATAVAAGTKGASAGAGQAVGAAQSVEGGVMAGIRRGFMTAAQHATNVSDVGQGLLRSGLQIGDMGSGGMVGHGADLGSQAGHIAHRGMLGDGSGQGSVLHAASAAVGGARGLLQRAPRVPIGGRESSAAMTVGDRLAAQGSHLEAAAAYEESALSAERDGNVADAVVANYRAFNQYLSGNDIANAQRVGPALIASARSMMQTNRGDRAMVAQAHMVMGGVSAQLGLKRYAAGDDRGAMSMLSEADGSLNSAGLYYQGQVESAMSRLAQEPTPQDLGAVQEYGLAAVQAAHMREQIGGAQGQVQNLAGPMLSQWRHRGDAIGGETALSLQSGWNAIEGSIGQGGIADLPTIAGRERR